MAERSPVILVTRPQPQADEWTGRLQALGLAASALPLIDISDAVNPGAVQAAWRQLSQIRLVIFVSPNAVQCFANKRPVDVAWPSSTLAAAPGPGTQHALHTHLQSAGIQPHLVVAPPADSLQFDSEHLWPVLRAQDWVGQRVLIISGGADGQAQGRPWLTQQLQAAGATVNSLLTYERQASQWTPAQRTLADTAYASPTSHLWLFSSSEAVQYLINRMGPPPIQALSMATHPRVAETAGKLGFFHPRVVPPRLEDLAQAVAQLPRS